MVPAGRAHRGARGQWAMALTLVALTARMVMPPAGLAAEEEGVSAAPPYPHLQVKADNTQPLNVRPEPNTRHEPLGALAPQDRTRYAIVGKDAAET